MLDAEGYPKAFFISNKFRFEFGRAAFYNGRIIADVTITPLKES
jgi:methionyl-tRNA formyltransferase